MCHSAPPGSVPTTAAAFVESLDATTTTAAPSAANRFAIASPIPSDTARHERHFSFEFHRAVLFSTAMGRALARLLDTSRQNSTMSAFIVSRAAAASRLANAASSS